jgi:hypothetical protein
MTPDEIQAAIERAEAKARETSGSGSGIHASDEGIHDAATGQLKPTGDKSRLGSKVSRAQR